MTPEIVLKASGHVDRFTDFMVTDAKTGDCHRADHLLEGALEALLEDTKAPPSKEAAHVSESAPRGGGRGAEGARRAGGQWARRRFWQSALLCGSGSGCAVSGRPCPLRADPVPCHPAPPDMHAGCA